MDKIDTYKLFELATKIGDPLAITGFILAALFFIFQQIINRDIFPRLSQRLAGSVIVTIINRLFVLALLAMLLGTGGWVWANNGETSLKGILYVHKGPNKKVVISGVDISVLQIGERGRTDEYGKFSIPVTKSDLRRKYTFKISFNNVTDFVDVISDSTDLKDLEFNLYDTISTKDSGQSTPEPTIDVSEVNIQNIPIVGSNPTYQSKKIICEVGKCKLVIKHNQVSTQSILVKSIQVEKVNIALSKKGLDSLNYSIDADKIQGYGIVLVKEYMVSFFKNKVSGKYILNKDKAVRVDPDNLFTSSSGSFAFTLRPSGDDAFLPLNINYQAIEPGFYKLRFNINYDVANKTKNYYTEWIHLLKK
jgi:hypothetical protein